MSLWKRTTPTTISRLHPYLSRSSESASQPHAQSAAMFRAKRETALGQQKATIS